ncbi:DUF3592 domain-containing protein [Cryptosporangium aurantiacum]|uniref:DUF3592 domain-containing protein n=1 Tax=Cryptosporangium aurantiacum TaxID=134849 RepID=A0A1M7RKA8_9ACTN|nr:DUF3592 domain-containing protein [Cryptosporangium aurantiacum]SHN46586.1 Protein of unknown function [Cryptosporangium aurantiacum]
MAVIVFVCVLSILFGLTIVGVAWFQASLRVDAATQFETATAEVLEKEWQREAGYNYRIEFRTQRRRRVRTEVKPTVAAPDFEVGDDMPVRYDPEHPQDVYLDHPGELSYESTMAGALSGGGTFILIGVGVLIWAFTSR